MIVETSRFRLKHVMGYSWMHCLRRPIRARLDAFDPFRVGAIPGNGIGKALFKGHCRLPTEFSLCITAFDGIPAVMSWTIRDVSNQRFRLTGKFEHELGDFHVVPLAPTAEIVDPTRFSLPKCGIDTSAVVKHVNPVGTCLPSP